LHTVAMPSEYVPAAQSKHLRSNDLYVPATHESLPHTLEPAGEVVPFGQEVHELALAEENVFAGQETQAEAPVADAYDPAAQLAHSVPPVVFLKVPALQFEHLPAFAAEKVPAKQAAHAVEPVAEAN